jgi:hypothetical protein
MLSFHMFASPQFRQPFVGFPGTFPASPDRIEDLAGVTKSFHFKLFHTLLRFFARSQNSTLLFSSTSTLLGKNTGGMGVPLPSPTPGRSEWGRVAFLTFLLPLSTSQPFVPLRPSPLGATIVLGATFLRPPGKQLRSPRCLSIMSGHRGRFDISPLCKSCLSLSF